VAGTAGRALAQEPIGKISLWRDNTRTDIADNGPAPNEAIVHSLYHFDLPHNILQKTRNVLESCLRNHQSRARRHSRQGQDGYHSWSGREFGSRINLS
jgi:hypothetical protein